MAVVWELHSVAIIAKSPTIATYYNFFLGQLTIFFGFDITLSNRSMGCAECSKIGPVP